MQLKLIIDGYNMIRQIDGLLASEEDHGLEAGRDALLMMLEPYGAQTGLEITVVFDGGGRPSELWGQLLVERFAGIDVIFSDRGRNADSVIVEMVEKEKKAMKKDAPFDLVVVTSDLGLKMDVIPFGAFVISPQKLFESMQEGKRPRY